MRSLVSCLNTLMTALLIIQKWKKCSISSKKCVSWEKYYDVTQPLRDNPLSFIRELTALSAWDWTSRGDVSATFLCGPRGSRGCKTLGGVSREGFGTGNDRMPHERPHDPCALQMPKCLLPKNDGWRIRITFDSRGSRNATDFLTSHSETFWMLLHFW